MFISLNMQVSTAHFKKKGRFLGDIEILDEHILSQSGCYKRVRRWLRGKHPSLGVLHFGYTGWETVQETDVISALQTFVIE